jgi:RNase P protein component
MGLNKRSAKRIAAKRNMLAGTPAVLATGLMANDNMRVGITVAPRKVIATQRESIKHTFAAVRLDMGEYQQTSTHIQEMQKLGVTSFDDKVV